MLATVFPFNTGKARKETTAKTCGENIKSHITDWSKFDFTKIKTALGII